MGREHIVNPTIALFRTGRKRIITEQRVTTTHGMGRLAIGDMIPGMTRLLPAAAIISALAMFGSEAYGGSDEGYANFAESFSNGMQQGFDNALQMRQLQIQEEQLNYQREQATLGQERAAQLEQERLQEIAELIQRDFVIEFVRTNFVEPVNEKLSWHAPQNYKIRKAGHEFFAQLQNSHPQTYRRYWNGLQQAYGEKTLDDYLTFFDVEVGDMRPLKRIPIVRQNAK